MMVSYSDEAFRFIFSLFFLFVPCSGLSWLPVSFYCTLNTQYRIILVSINKIVVF